MPKPGDNPNLRGRALEAPTPELGELKKQTDPPVFFNTRGRPKQTDPPVFLNTRGGRKPKRKTKKTKKMDHHMVPHRTHAARAARAHLPDD